MGKSYVSQSSFVDDEEDEGADSIGLNDDRAFDQFTTDLTVGNGSTFVLVGSTTAITDLAIGKFLSFS